MAAYGTITFCRREKEEVGREYEFDNHIDKEDYNIY
jgi:hypothetical protein